MKIIFTPGTGDQQPRFGIFLQTETFAHLVSQVSYHQTGSSFSAI